MIHRLSLLFIIFIFFAGCNGQTENKSLHQAAAKDTVRLDFYDKARLLALEEGKIGKIYTFKIEQDTGINELQVVYIGNIQTTQGKVLKVLSSTNYYSLVNDVKHSSASVWLYNNSNDILGNYYVGSDASLPSKVEGENLIFDFHNNQCDQKTEISFADSIPKQIFVNCTGKGGDMWTFAPGIGD